MDVNPTSDACQSSHGSSHMFVVLPTSSSAEQQGKSQRTSTSKRRAAIACQNCSQRKVRCNVTTIGPPCTNCKYDATPCEIVTRKSHRRRKHTRNVATSLQEGQQTTELPRASQTPTEHYLSPLSGQSTSLLQDHGEPFLKNITSSSPDGSTANSSTDLQANEPTADIETDETNDYAAALDENTPPNSGSLSYLGDKQGLGGFVYEICYPGGPHKAMHYLLPKTSHKHLGSHDITSLQQRGALSLLPEQVSDKLLHAYFLHVHYFLPIIDVERLLGQYTTSGCQGISQLLLWSMFLAAANFVGVDTLQEAGFQSRKEFKRAMYERAKALYDSDYESDKVLLIQVVILMGFWYTETQDQGGAWYWIGIAIGLCQTLGLHRCPVILSHKRLQLPEARQRLLRRLWWVCVVRDRWLSLVKGRPMRINHEDCDMPMPTADDITKELDSIPSSVKIEFFPSDTRTLADMWISFVKISVSLGTILRTHYRPRARPAVQDIEDCANELRLGEPEPLSALQIENADDIIQLHAYQLQLFYEAAVVVLYRPYVLVGPATLPLQEQAHWQKIALQRARTAACNTNALLEKLISIDAVRYLRPMIISTMIPAMQIHLFDCKSSSLLLRRVGNHKLDFCMLVLSELRETYWGADFTYLLFERAQKKLSEILPSSEIIASNPQVGNEILAVENVEQIQSNSSLGTGDELWSNDQKYFPTFDQLLSPGFSLSEDVYQFMYPL